MNLAVLENKILHEIPILKSIGVHLLKIENRRCLISVPLAPNHNHKGTVFGGSLYTACTAACYALLYGLQVQSNALGRDLVITKGEIQYLKPTKNDFVVVAEVDKTDLENLLKSLQQNRPNRIQLKAFVRDSEFDSDLCQFIGEFAFVKALV